MGEGRTGMPSAYVSKDAFKEKRKTTQSFTCRAVASFACPVVALLAYELVGKPQTTSLWKINCVMFAVCFII